uniref:Uncharacterized protein n=1 Tax=Oryza sativa subsp. japonica TaxID=39947 RepID=Q6EPW2_ORYSJ|nr:hypothetical protein [Oryza sativa Japonica Group]BAD29308.1 hypothetical protein [Oryza sativa Japonica Group]
MVTRPHICSAGSLSLEIAPRMLGSDGEPWLWPELQDGTGGRRSKRAPAAAAGVVGADPDRSAAGPSEGEQSGGALEDAIDAADHPDALRARRDGIAERLYTALVVLCPGRERGGESEEEREGRGKK